MIVTALAALVATATPGDVERMAFATLAEVPIEHRSRPAARLAAGLASEGRCEAALRAIDMAPITDVEEYRYLPGPLLTKNRTDCARSFVDRLHRAVSRPDFSPPLSDRSEQLYRVGAYLIRLGEVEKGRRATTAAERLIVEQAAEPPSRETAQFKAIMELLLRRSGHELELPVPDPLFDVRFDALHLFRGTEHWRPRMDELIASLGTDDREQAERLMNAAALNGEIDLAESIRERWEIAPTWRLMDAYWERGRRSEAMALLETMPPHERDSLSLLFYDDADFFLPHVGLFASWGGAGMGSGSDLLGSLADARLDDGFVEQAREIAERAVELAPADACPQSALRTLDRINGIDFTLPNACTLRPDARFQPLLEAIEAGEWGRFEQLFGEMPASEERKVFIAYLPGYLDMLDNDLKAEFAQRYAAWLTASVDPSADFIWLSSGLERLATHIDPHAALHLAPLLPADRRASALKRIAARLRSSEETEAARAFLSAAEGSLASAREPDRMATEIATTWALLGEDARALNLANSIADPALRLEPLVMLITAEEKERP